MGKIRFTITIEHVVCRVTDDVLFAGSLQPTDTQDHSVHLLFPGDYLSVIVIIKR